MNITTSKVRFTLKHLLLRRIVFLLGLVVTLRIFIELLEYNRRSSKCKSTLKPLNSQIAQIDLGLKVSIIIPTLNEAEALPNLFRSISAQTYSNIEVIVIDAMSEDGTARVVKEFGDKLISVTAKSVGYQSDIGARASSGEIIIRCDADTIFTPRHVETVLTTFLSNTNAKVFHCGHWFYDGVFLDNFVAFLYDKYWRRLDGTSGAMTAITREAYLDSGGYDAKMTRGEDFDLGRRVVAKYGAQSIIYDYENLVTPVSARAIRKIGRQQYYRRLGGSFF